jgi:hypothetical protein
MCTTIDKRWLSSVHCTGMYVQRVPIIFSMFWDCVGVAQSLSTSNEHIHTGSNGVCTFLAVYAEKGVLCSERSKERLENWRGLTLAGLHWRQNAYQVEVEAAQGVLYCRPLLGAVQLLSEVYASCWGGGLRCNFLQWRHSINFQYPICVKPSPID